MISIKIFTNRHARQPRSAILGAVIGLMQVAPAWADDGRISLNGAYHRNAFAGGSLAITDGREVSSRLSSNSLFEAAANLHRAVNSTQSRNTGTAKSSRSGRQFDLESGQQGAVNNTIVTQGDIAKLLISQNGSSNESRVSQAGQNATAIFVQNGSGNVISGAQAGPDNRAHIIQSGMHQYAGFSQSGAGSTLTVRQR